MGDFRQFLVENEEALAKIQEIVNSMESDEVDQFGYYLYNEFFDTDQDGDDEEMFFGHDDVMEMIQDLGPEMYEDILDLLSEVSDEEFGEFETEDGVIPDEKVSVPDFGGVSEGVSRIMLGKNRNHKKRKFMTNSRTKMRQTAAIRKRLARQNRNKVKRYYRANKAKIKAYQKSRRDAIKSGKHIVKMRRNGG